MTAHHVRSQRAQDPVRNDEVTKVFPPQGRLDTPPQLFLDELTCTTVDLKAG